MARERMSVAHVKVSLLTGGTAGGAHPRIASWLRLGFERLGEPFDVVHVERPADVQRIGSTRIVKLGTRRLRWAGLPMMQYLMRASPGVALATPIEVAVLALTVSRLSESRIVPWEQTLVRLHRRPGRFRMLPLLELMTYGRASGIAVTSREVGDGVFTHLAERIAGRPVELLPNPIAADEIRTLAGSGHLNSPSRELRLCAVGRLAHEKGYDILIDALSLAAPKLPTRWKQTIIGAGPLRPRLERRAQECGLDGHIEFAGYVSNPYEAMAQSDILVHPARSEGFGIVIAEALTLGVSVVATSCPGGPREILDNGRFGILVRPEDPVAFSEGIERVAGDAQLRKELAAAGPERAKAYSPEVVAERALAIAESVC